MKRVKVVVMLLTKDFFKKRTQVDVVYAELKYALGKPETCFLPIVFEGFSYEKEDLSAFNEEEISRFKYKSPIPYYGIYADNLETKIIPAIYDLLKGGFSVEESSKRGNKKYVGYADERNYMARQQALLCDYDNAVRNPLLIGAKTVLDIGCNDGFCIMNNFYGKGEISNIVGIDIQKECIENAIKNCPEGVHFYVVDIESHDFDNKLTAIENELGIEGFDLINIEMVLLHLAKPRDVLKVLKKHLNKNGYVFIRDIDDDFNFFYPDPENILRRLQNMVKYLDSWGYRQSGKEIYSHLKLAGFSNVSIEKQGLNTVGLDFDEVESLFNVYFGDIAKTAYITCESHPESIFLANEAQWAKEHIDEALNLFHRNDFVFSLGYIIYVAKK